MKIKCWIGLVLATIGLPMVAAAEERTITVLYTSDVHARVLPMDEVRGVAAPGSLAQVAAYVSSVRRESRHTVVLDGGDAIQGTPLAHYALAAADSEIHDPTVAAMNLVGYDAAVLGNHEFNYGLRVLSRSIEQSRFPWLAANLDGAAAAGLKVLPTVILRQGGVRIGVVGLTNPNVPNWDPPEHWEGLTFLDPLEVARAQVAALRPRVDLLIVVAHSGFDRNLDTGDPVGGRQEDFAWDLAHLEGVDVLLTGHTHRNIPPRTVGRAVVAQPGRWAQLVTRIDVDMKRRGNGWQMAGWRGENVPMAGLAADERVLAAVEQARLRAVAELDRVVGELTEPLVLGGVPVRDDPAVDLIHQAQLWATGAELSMAAPLAMSPLEIPAGPVNPRMLHGLYPYPNTLLAVSLTGLQVREVLEHAVRGWTGVECGQPDWCALMRDPRVPGYSFDTMEGVTYAVDVTAPPGSRIRALRFAGEPIDHDRVYTVAVNSYRASGSGGYPHLKNAPRVVEVHRQMVDILASFFEARGTVHPLASDNYFFVLSLHARPPEGVARTR